MEVRLAPIKKIARTRISHSQVVLAVNQTGRKWIRVGTLSFSFRRRISICLNIGIIYVFHGQLNYSGAIFYVINCVNDMELHMYRVISANTDLNVLIISLHACTDR